MKKGCIKRDLINIPVVLHFFSIFGSVGITPFVNFALFFQIHSFTIEMHLCVIDNFDQETPQNHIWKLIGICALDTQVRSAHFTQFANSSRKKNRCLLFST